MESIRNKAKELLDNKTVQLVIGYENGTSGRIRPAFISDSAKADRLIFNEQCVHNLAGFVLKPEVKRYGKIALVATLPVMRTVLMLISEQQLAENDLIILGIGEDGKLLEIPSINVLENYISKCDLGNPAKDKITLEKLTAMNLQDRWNWWQDELSKCIKCYACRQACPLCYCVRCAVECNQPQWIPVPAHQHGNMEWHMMRAMHLAGRCISCGECGRACPLDIPVHLLTMQMADETYKMFGVHSGTSAKMDSLLSSFKLEDKENFIH